MSKKNNEFYNTFPSKLGGSENGISNLSDNNIETIMNKDSVVFYHDDIDSILISAKITKFFTEKLKEQTEVKFKAELNQLNELINKYGVLKQAQFDELKKKLDDHIALTFETVQQKEDEIARYQSRIQELQNQLKIPTELSEIQNELEETKQNLSKKEKELGVMKEKFKEKENQTKELQKALDTAIDDLKAFEGGTNPFPKGEEEEKTESESELASEEEILPISANDSLPSRIIIAIYSDNFLKGTRTIEDDKKEFVQPLLLSKKPENFDDDTSGFSDNLYNTITKGMTVPAFTKFQNEIFLKGKKIRKKFDEGVPELIKFFDVVTENNHNYEKLIYDGITESVLIETVKNSINVKPESFKNLLSEEEKK